MTPLLFLVLLVAVATAGVWWLRRTWVVVAVRGLSMLPTYRDGDRVLVRRRPIAAVRAGQVVVLRPGDDMEIADEESWIIKRVAAAPGDPVPAGEFPVPDRVVRPDALLVVGDNPARSADSRRHGYYSGTLLLGVVTRAMSR